MAMKFALIAVALLAGCFIVGAGQAAQKNWPNPILVGASLLCVLGLVWVLFRTLASCWMTISITSEGIQFSVFRRHSLLWKEIASWRQGSPGAPVEIVTVDGSKLSIINVTTNPPRNDAIAGALNHFVPTDRTEMSG